MKEVGKQTIKGYENAKWWEEMGVNALQLALFAVAELATGGAAIFFLALGAGVGVVRAEQSWEAWQEKNAAAKSNVSDETKLLESGDADAALISAVLDTATAFLDLATHAFNYSIHGARGFTAVADIVDLCDCYRFTYSRLDDAVQVASGIEGRQAGGRH